METMTNPNNEYDDTYDHRKKTIVKTRTKQNL